MQRSKGITREEKVAEIIVMIKNMTPYEVEKFEVAVKEEFAKRRFNQTTQKRALEKRERLMG